MQIILASEAPWRSEILTQLGIPHRCIAHRYEEPAYESGSLSDFVQWVALEKGRSIQRDFPSSIIVSADQLIALDGEVFYKSGTRENAVLQLTKLNGREHRLISAVAVLSAEKSEVRFEEAKLKMKHLTAEEIKNYVDRDEPWNCAGSYKYESLGASLFEWVNVQDPNTIVGIPGNLLIEVLGEWGFADFR
ncbi:MAG: septum formation protein Maf [Proteobacteria bacterium]|nr:septum formation protein Maf [Pseudomonadota bacterium]